MAGIVANAIGGSVAGIAGTLAKTVIMRVLVPSVAPQVRTAFPPKQVIDWAERRTEAELSKAEEVVAVTAAHFGYGAGSGLVYGASRSWVRDAPAPVAGALFGALVWGVSFAGWMPAAGVRRPLREQPRREQLAPLFGHLVFGITTALVLEALSRRREREASPAQSRRDAHNSLCAGLRE